MSTGLKHEITDVQDESDMKAVDLKFNSKDEKDRIYKLLREEFPLSGKVAIGNLTLNDDNVISILYTPEDKERVMNFIKQYQHAS
jgi:hypothetical protein